MKYYRKVPHPFANTLGEEVFQAGLIPSDTDFRIFRDYGGVPGLDMAYIFNGYVYHSKYDRVNIFPRASLQHTGDNVLALARELGNAPELDDIEVSKEKRQRRSFTHQNFLCRLMPRDTMFSMTFWAGSCSSILKQLASLST